MLNCFTERQKTHTQISFNYIIGNKKLAASNFQHLMTTKHQKLHSINYALNIFIKCRLRITSMKDKLFRLLRFISETCTA